MPRYTRQARQRARALRKQATFPERLLWSKLRRKQLGARIVRQQPIGSFIVDFYCPSKRLVIEVDGRSHDESGAYDLRREAELRQRGYNIARFTNDEILADLEGVTEQISRLLAVLEE